jgi:hypothetical protein
MKHTFQSPDHSQDDMIRDNGLDYGIIVQEDKGFHDVAEAMEVD